MMDRGKVIFSTSLKTQPTGKPRSFTSLPLPLRHLRARPRRNITGKERDSETGLYYYGARYLDPMGTPGRCATIGLRASFGEYEDKETTGSLDFGIRTISLALNVKAELRGMNITFELRKEIINFDTSSGRPEFTFLNSNNNRFGIRSDNQIIQMPWGGTLNIGSGGRVNGF